MTYPLSRRSFLQASAASMATATLSSALAFSQITVQSESNTQHFEELQLTSEWDKTFPLSQEVNHQKVTFHNRYGITLAADLYAPRDISSPLPAIILSGPFGAVKEQSAGLHGQTMAERGFVTLAFDRSFTGESGGLVRNVASPDIFTEDFSAAVDFLMLQPFVNHNAIGILAICGLTGMALTAAASDHRIKAVATTAMYNMSRSMTRGHQDYYTESQQQAIIEYLGQQRTRDAQNGNFAKGLHELPFDQSGNIVTATALFPESLPGDADEVSKSFFAYYKTARGFHPRSINSTTAWTATTPMAFFNFSLMDNISRLHQPILLVTGTRAHSRYYSEDVYRAIPGNQKELLVIDDADHVDLYDNRTKIPFDRFEQFFQSYLK